MAVDNKGNIDLGTSLYACSCHNNHYNQDSTDSFDPFDSFGRFDSSDTQGTLHTVAQGNILESDSIHVNKHVT